MLISFAGAILDMGTEFRASPLATRKAAYTVTHGVSADMKESRFALMGPMSEAGFVNYPTECWHWSDGDKYWALTKGAPGAIYSSMEVQWGSIVSKVGFSRFSEREIFVCDEINAMQ